MRAKQERQPELYAGRGAEVFRTAARLILERGYDATSVSDIANALGITKAGLYHYIRGKTDLLYRIMQYGLKQLDREVMVPAAEIEDPEERLRFIITTHARLVTRGNAAITILVEESRALSPSQLRAVTRLKRAYLETLRTALDELRRQRRLRDIDSTVAAFSIIAMVNWLSRWYQSDGKLTPAQIADQIVDMTFYGILKRARAGMALV